MSFPFIEIIIQCRYPFSLGAAVSLRGGRGKLSSATSEIFLLVEARILLGLRSPHPPFTSWLRIMDLDGIGGGTVSPTCSPTPVLLVGRDTGDFDCPSRHMWGGASPIHFFLFPSSQEMQMEEWGGHWQKKQKQKHVGLLCSSVPLFLLVQREKKTALIFMQQFSFPSICQFYLSSTPLLELFK